MAHRGNGVLPSSTSASLLFVHKRIMLRLIAWVLGKAEGMAASEIRSKDVAMDVYQLPSNEAPGPDTRELAHPLFGCPGLCSSTGHLASTLPCEATGAGSRALFRCAECISLGLAGQLDRQPESAGSRTKGRGAREGGRE